MPKFSVVIGANFGDEGKGRCVDWLCAQPAPTLPLVVRYHGSGQAGHTVVIGKTRHVFKHFGSGTLRGAPTLLCHKFVINPSIFNEEWRALSALLTGELPKIYVSDGCEVTLPTDTLFNQILEQSRGADRYGSCGIGFGETLQRANDAGWNTPLTDMLEWEEDDSDYYKFAVDYYERRIEESKINWDNVSPELKQVHESVVNDTFPWNVFIAELKTMVERVEPVSGADYVIDRFDHVIFEGAQGLLLSEYQLDYFPHVTRSVPGLIEAIALLRECGWEDVNDLDIRTYYCTRTYLTRHGAGPLLGEVSRQEMSFHGCTIADKTNQEGPYQGKLRFAPLDVSGLSYRIGVDTAICPTRPIVVVGHCDLTRENIVNNLVEDLAEFAHEIHLGYGESSDDTVIKPGFSLVKPAQTVELV